MAKKTAHSNPEFRTSSHRETDSENQNLDSYIFEIENKEGFVISTNQLIAHVLKTNQHNHHLVVTLENINDFMQSSVFHNDEKIGNHSDLKLRLSNSSTGKQFKSGVVHVTPQVFYGGSPASADSSDSKAEREYRDQSHLIKKVFEKDIENLKTQFSELKKEVDELRETNDKLKDILFNTVAKYEAESSIQFIPVNIYLDTEDSNHIYTAYQSVLDFLTEIGFENSIDFKAEKGSWIKRIIAKSMTAMTSDEVVKRLKEAEYAVEVNTILKPQSEVEKNQSEAFVGVISSLQGIQNAAIRIGSLIVVKVTSPTGEVSVQTRTLSIEELHIINKHPELLQQPQQVLKALNSYLERELPPEN